jgi:hypothetical protein
MGWCAGLVYGYTHMFMGCNDAWEGCVGVMGTALLCMGACMRAGMNLSRLTTYSDLSRISATL